MKQLKNKIETRHQVGMVGLLIFYNQNRLNQTLEKRFFTIKVSFVLFFFFFALFQIGYYEDDNLYFSILFYVGAPLYCSNGKALTKHFSLKFIIRTEKQHKKLNRFKH